MVKISVTMTSLISGKQHTREYEMTREQIGMYCSANRPNIQNIFPDMSDELREFLVSGITPEEWNATFPKEEDE